MANHASAKKRARQNETRRIRNKAIKSKVNTLVGKVLDSTEKEQAEVVLKSAVSAIDKAASKGKLHKNTAARKKARLTKFVNKLEK
ncbi:MAG: 30S ribosomal protein S20 [Melioribacteraceae bacterium]|jgi:small subunit ribosomal protein S20|nr:30S ribosomal protein S20 [Melioribacteraceae bacterium]RJP56434.1 MAG: 30S ribosomal protein S20 [Ignavibacteriales bacterium]WKZ68923.1 MAG: 30S ribosomal protein S20 [Melioribacteraceae bacterium]